LSPATLLHPLQLAAALVAAALLLVGCSSSSPQAIDETPLATPTSTSDGSGETASPDPGTETATPTGTSIASGTEVAAVIEAATAALDARYLSPLSRDACLEDNEAGQICIALASDEGSVEAGIARFDAGDPNGGPFSFFMGRDATGAWQYWFGTQQQSYVLQSVPGELLACGLGEATTVRPQPSSDADATMVLEKQASLTAEEFLITVAGGFGAGGERGEGWYRVSAPAEGWVNAREVTDAALGDCLLHDAIEQTAHG